VSREALDYLRVDDLLEIAASVVSHVTSRDAGLLASAVGRPQLTVYGENAYPTFDEKAAALLHLLVRTPALVDGNKRLAWAATRVLCIIDGRELDYTVDDAEHVTLGAAAGDLDVPEIARWLPNHRR
jgi:death-on-curing protein